VIAQSNGPANPHGGPPLFDVLLNQRACRDYASAPVDDNTIAAILVAASHAPCADNKQPWVFVVVRDPRTQKAIHDLSEAGWVGAGRDRSETRLEPHLFKEVDYGFAGGGFRTAPVLVVVCVDLARGMRATVGSSIFPCVQNLLLAAAAYGLGSALTTLVAQFADEMRALLDLPDHVVPQAVIPLGVPAHPLGSPRRDPIADHTHRDRYGNRW
jgi:nitroreductase